MWFWIIAVIITIFIMCWLRIFVLIIEHSGEETFAIMLMYFFITTYIFTFVVGVLRYIEFVKGGL